MRVLIIGTGGREHALAVHLAKSPLVSALFAAPGNAGISQVAQLADIKATDIDKIVAFCLENRIDFVVVTPDDPLALGAVDALNAQGIACFGPNQAAARIESSKIYAKRLMEKALVPTARFEVFDDVNLALQYVKTQPCPVVIKADGLALGKGVIIAQNPIEAEEAVREMMEDGRFGAAGSRVVIEQFMTGPEMSLMVLTDGKSIRVLPSAMDHKRAGDGDTGPNTGGMGAIAPHPLMTPALQKEILDTIVKPVLAAMAQDGCPFKGCLYAGLMLCADGPKVIEFNARFGDPETQAIMGLLTCDLMPYFVASASEGLARLPEIASKGASCCITLASGGYPGVIKKGFPISVGKLPDGIQVYHAGTARQGEKIVTSGGRVMSLCALASDLKDAVRKAYEAIDSVQFENMYYRRDIGRQALKEQDSHA